MTPLVSVIIPCFNCEQYIEQSVKSVLNQTFTDLECIIVDDGSTDNTRHIGEALMNKDPRVQYLLKEHAGVSAARNFGIRHARGSWIQMLDADDWLHEDKIRFQLNYLNDIDPEEDIVFYSDYEIIKEDADHNIVRKKTNTFEDFTNQQLLEHIMMWRVKGGSPLHANNTLFKKTVFNKKMYNESFTAFEDLDLFVDLLLKNVSFIHTPIIGMTYRRHQSNMTIDQRLMVRSDTQYLEEVYQKDKKLLRLCPDVERLIKQSLKEKDKDIFRRLIRLKQGPVPFLDGMISIDSTWLLELLYFISSFTPMSIQRASANLSRRVKNLIS